MFDCSDDIRAFHLQKVTLPQKEQKRMKDWRNANRNRLTNGLKHNEKPVPYEFVSQGSYAMKTMLRDKNKHYDIDDGAYFDFDDLLGDRGGAMSALDVRKMVRDALDDGSFNEVPEVKTNCVRVLYQAGYHVDIPVYRRMEDAFGMEYFELASGSVWTSSDARDVSDWYESTRNMTSDANQFRHLNRLLKHFAKSRDSWRDRVLSGFGITALLAMHHELFHRREDKALYWTMKQMKYWLDVSTVIYHPVTSNSTITTGNPDSKASFFRDKVGEALDWLDPLFDTECNREKALRCCDKVFHTSFFSQRYESEKQEESARTRKVVKSSVAIVTANTANAINRKGSDRYA